MGYQISNRRPGSPSQRQLGNGFTWLPTAAIGMVSGLLAGLVIGVAARVAMRLIAMTVGQPSVFTVSGTIGVFSVSAIPAVLIGLLFVVVSRWLPGPTVVKGLIFGGVLLLVLGVPILLDGLPDPEGEFPLYARGIATALFAVLFVLFGAVLALVVRLLESRWPRPDVWLNAAVVAIFTVLGVVGLFMTVGMGRMGG